ncbi:FMN-binding negative transcriptional regulator [Comamonas sp.]|uniref:FMN-binding negative transcriptional regulator n=1 Tax=Comamonas sp. TaxID=34028 RepID=UPI0028A14044|nr:FMN-binding negative transcriptional regulator [Comamonas sp.]
MYNPPQFVETDLSELHRIIEEHPLGMLVTNVAGEIDINHIPFLLDSKQGEHGVLLTHVARSNQIWKQLQDGDQVVVVFRGAAGYISPTWYPGKVETHRRVPTWNYEVAHVHCRVTIRDDEKFLRGMVGRLTKEHEASMPKPWKLSDAPPDFMQQQLANIVGLEFRIERIDGKRKLNQHHAKADRDGAVEGLASVGNHALSQAMAEATPYQPK